MVIATAPPPTLDKEYYERRRADILMLRNYGKMTYIEIAERYDVSRQRIHQIVGTQSIHEHYGASARTVMDKHWLEKHKHLTNAEMAKLTGLSYCSISKYRSNMWHQHSGAGLRVSSNGVEFVKNVLESFGYCNTEMMPTRDLRDIVIHREHKDVTLDVKISTKDSKPPSRNNGADSYLWHWQLRRHKQKRGVVDFYILVIWKTRDCFVIPVNDVPEHRTDLLFVFPNDYGRHKSWQKYHERWDLIEDLFAH